MKFFIAEYLYSLFYFHISEYHALSFIGKTVHGYFHYVFIYSDLDICRIRKNDSALKV